MRTRLLASIAVIAALVTGSLVGIGSAPAAALSPGLTFSADSLPTWQTNGVVRAVAAANGRVVAVGEFTQIRPGAGQSGSTQNVTGLAIFDAATGQPTTCQLPAALSGGTARLYAAEASPDGQTVVVGGNFNSIGGVGRTRIAEINPTTCAVTSFNVSGVSSFVYSLEVTSDAVYLGGLFQTVAGQPRRSFAKVDRSGALDATWVADAVGNMETRPEPGIECRTTADANSRGLAIEVSPDGSKVVLGGSFYSVNGTNTHSIAVVGATDGAVVKGYPANPSNWGSGSNFIHPCSITKAIESDGSYFYIGNEGSGGGVFDGTARLSWSSLEQDWRDTCLGAVQALVIKNDLLYQAHHHHDCSSIGQYPDGRRMYLSATDVDDPRQYQIGWNPTLNDGTGEGIGGRGLAVARSGSAEYLWVVGEFTRVNGVAQQGLTRFGTTDTGNPPTPQINVRAVTSGALQISARSVVDPDDGPLQYILYRNNVQVGSPVTAESLWWVRPQVTFVDTDVTPGVSYSYRVRAVDAAGNQSALSAAQNGVATAQGSAYAETVLSDEPTLYWRYDDVGNWVIDRSGPTGAGKNGIAQNGVGYAGGALPGDSSSSASFDGTNQYAWNDQIAYGPSTYSIETWFKTSSTTGGALVAYGNGRPRSDSGVDVASSNYDRMIYMEPGTGRLRFGVYADGVRSIRSSAAFNDDQWHHVVATQGSQGMRMYVDGVEVGSNGVTSNQQYYGTWRVGGSNLNGWPDNGGNAASAQFYDGLLDETAIYGGALTQRQVVDHFRAGGGDVDVNDEPESAYGAAVYGDNPSFYWPLDETGGTTAEDSSFLGNRDGTVGSAVGRLSSGTVQGGAVQTPGSNSGGSGVISTSQVGAPTAYSMEFWINTTTTSGGKIMGFENSATETGNSYDKHVYMLNDGRLRFGVYIGSVQVVTSGASYNDGAWHHVVATQDSTGMKLYVDGTLVGQGPVTTSETGDGFWRIGGGNIGGWPDQPSSYYFNGKIDEVAVYPAALSAQSVVNHRVIGLNDTTAPTVPTGVSQSGSSAQLTWSTSTDANGVAGYRVYRGATAGFEATAATLVGDVTLPTWTDPDVAPSQRYYRVTAYDAAGNESAASASVQVTVADTTAPSVPTGLAASVAGTDVALTWNASTDDVGVDHYAVYRGTTADFSIGGLTPIGEPTTAGYDDTGLAEGTWYYRVVAVDAAGNASVAGTSVAAVVDIDTDAPTTPTGLETSVAGNGVVTLSWTASTDDVGVAGYRVYRGTTATFTADADSLVDGGVTSPTWDDPDTTLGQRYYRVVAFDAAGNASGASTTASATVSDSVAPSTPAGLAAVASGSDVTLTWNAATDNVGVDRYRVYRGTTAGFSISGQTPIEETSATSLVDADRPDGTWHYRVVAVDGADNASAPSASVSVSVDTSEPVEPVTLTVSPVADTMVAQAAPTTVYGATTQLSARTASASPIESYLSFDIPAAPAGLELTGATIRLTTSTDASAASTGAHQLSLMTGSWNESTTTWNTRPTTGFGVQVGELTGATALNTTYQAVLDADELEAGSTVNLVLRSTSTDNLRVVSREGTGVNRRPAIVLEYTPATTPDPEPEPEPEPDTTAPTVPSGVTGTGTASGAVELQWTASTDAVGVTGYRVYSGSSADFSVGSASLVGSPTATSFSQTGVAAGTRYYRVAAVDAAGNQSAASASTAVEIPEAPVEPVTVTVTAQADAMVAQASSGTNYGSATYLSTRSGGSNALASYLSFEIPSAPAGTVLTSAVLRLRTTTDASSGSAQDHTVALVSGSWNEGTLTWANRPTASGATLGTVTGSTNVNTSYETTLDAAGLRSLTGSTGSLLVTASGDDNLRFWSKEATNSGFRPALVLTFAPPA